MNLQTKSAKNVSEQESYKDRQKTKADQDQLWNNAATKRDTKNARFIPHHKAWE